MVDMVNHPPHYKTDSGLECIDVIEAFFPHDVHLSHVFKYLARADKKGSPEENVRKALWWLNRKLEFMRKGLNGGSQEMSEQPQD